MNTGYMFLTASTLVLGIVYFLPTIFAAVRSHHNALPIFILNLFLGWSGIGWVICLAMACTNLKPPVYPRPHIRTEPRFTKEDPKDNIMYFSGKDA